MPPIPAEIGPYRVLRPLGQGGMGTVLLAEDPRLQRRVALKLFSGVESRTEYARQQLLQEARAAAALSHPNIAAVHDVLDADGQVAIVFEYVEGETLASRLCTGALPFPTALSIGLQLADALSTAHDHGIIHRDLKPANVILTTKDRVKVLDFGVARVIPRDPSEDASGHTTRSGFVGTVGYAPPEQCLGQPVDARADVFSLGVVLYEMLTGKRPFSGKDATAVMRAMLQSDPPHASVASAEVPEPLDRLLTSMLSRDAAERPQTARQVHDMLGYLVPSDVRYVATRKTRGRVIASMLVVALATGALLSSLFWNRSAPSPPHAAAKPPVVAVMPLTNASGDPTKDYVASGVADNLITRLAALPSVTVLSRAAVAEARSRKRDLTALAAELDATYLVDGSVQQAGDALQISLNLVRSDASVAWADTVRGAFTDIFDLQTRLASALAQALAVQLSPADRASLTRQPTLDAEALAEYWRGRALLDRRDVKGNVEAALAAFDRAVALDPRFADAHAARGEALWERYIQTNDPVSVQQAVDAGTEALRLAPDRPHVRYLLALTLDGSGRSKEAVDELQRALALQPNYDDARRRLGLVLARQGRVDEAVAEFQKAITLRPNYWGHYSALGFALFQAARYEAAAEAFSRVIELQPDSAFGYQQLGAVNQQLGNYDKALAYYRQAIAISPNPQAYTNIGGILHQRGEYREAVAAYRQSIQLRPNSHVAYRNLGDALKRLGQMSEARKAYLQAISIIDTELQVNPRDARTIAYLSVYLAKAGRATDAETRIQEALAIAPADVQVLYRSAVVYALVGRTDAALENLSNAVAKGYSRRAAAEEEDFEALRKRPQFQDAIVGRFNKGAR